MVPKSHNIFNPANVLDAIEESSLAHLISHIFAYKHMYQTIKTLCRNIILGLVGE